MYATVSNISAAATVIREHIARGTVVRLITSPPASMVATQESDAIRLLAHLALLSSEEAEAAPPPVGESPLSLLIGPRASASGVAEVMDVPSRLPRLDARP